MVQSMAVRRSSSKIYIFLLLVLIVWFMGIVFVALPTLQMNKSLDNEINRIMIRAGMEQETYHQITRHNLDRERFLEAMRNEAQKKAGFIPVPPLNGDKEHEVVGVNNGTAKVGVMFCFGISYYFCFVGFFLMPFT